MSKMTDRSPAWVDETIRQILGAGRRRAARRVVRGTAAGARVASAAAVVPLVAAAVAAWRGWWQPGPGMQVAAAVLAASSLAVHQAAHLVLRHVGRDAR